MVRFDCTNCGKRYRVAERYVDRQDRCPNCRTHGQVCRDPRSITRTNDLDRIVPAVTKSRTWIGLLCVQLTAVFIIQSIVCVQSSLTMVISGRTVESTVAAVHDVCIAAIAGLLAAVLFQCLKYTQPFHRTHQAITLLPTLDAIALCWRRLSVLSAVAAMGYLGILAVDWLI